MGYQPRLCRSNGEAQDQLSNDERFRSSGQSRLGSACKALCTNPQHPPPNPYSLDPQSGWAVQEQWRGPSSKLPEAQQGGEGSDEEAQRLEDGIDMIQAWLRVYGSWAQGLGIGRCSWTAPVVLHVEMYHSPQQVDGPPSAAA